MSGVPSDTPSWWRELVDDDPAAQDLAEVHSPISASLYGQGEIFTRMGADMPRSMLID